MQNQDTQDIAVQFTFPEKTERVEYKHVFDEKERLHLGDELNNQLKEKNQMELDKKSAASTWKSRIEAKDAEMNVTGNYLRDGYKFEFIDAIKKVNPLTLEWEYFHPENAEWIESRKMSQKEIREVFPRQKNLEKKLIEYYNPQTLVVVDSRPMSAEELQLTLDDEALASDNELNEIFNEDGDSFEGGELKPRRKKK